MSFLSLFLGKKEKRPPEEQGFLSPPEPPKSLEIRENTEKKTNARKEKATKEELEKEGQGLSMHV